MLAGCGGSDEGITKPSDNNFVQGQAVISPRNLNPMIMLSDMKAFDDVDGLSSISYCKLHHAEGSISTVPFGLKVPKNANTSTKYLITIFDDRDGDGKYDANRQPKTGGWSVSEFIGHWEYYLVFDGQKWHVEDKSGKCPSWGADATRTGDHIVVESWYLK